MSTPHRLRVLVLVLLFAALPSVSLAQLIAYDNFSGYSAVGLNGQGTGLGFGWTSNWSTGQPGNFTADPGSGLTYAGLTTETGLISASPSGNAGVGRDFAPVGSGTVYFGALVQYYDTASVIRIFALGDDGTTNHAGGVMLGQMDGSHVWSAETTYQYISTDPYTGDYANYRYGSNSAIGVTTAPTYLVGKIEFNTSGSSDSMYLWVNPTSAAELQNNATANASLVNPYDIGNVSHFSVYLNTTYGGGSSGFALDEVRVATDANLMFGTIPEPSAWTALAGLAALGFALRRRSA